MNLHNKIAIAFFLVVGVIGVTIAIHLNRTGKKGRAEYATFFYYKELDDTIVFVKLSTMGVVNIKLDSNIDSVYSFAPRRSDNIQFYKQAKFGDRFIKHADNDTVWLISDGKTYDFIITRPVLPK